MEKISISNWWYSCISYLIQAFGFEGRIIRVILFKSLLKDMAVEGWLDMHVLLY